MEEHPSIQARRPSLIVFAWRYFTGHYLDGKPRDRHIPHASWWTRKHRAHRALWRWGIIVIPVAWVFALYDSPWVRINLVWCLTLTAVPYLFHHGILAITRNLPTHHEVRITVPMVVEVPEEREGIAQVIGIDATDELDGVFDVPPVSREGRVPTVRMRRNSSRVNPDEASGR